MSVVQYIKWLLSSKAIKFVVKYYISAHSYWSNPQAKSRAFVKLAIISVIVASHSSWPWQPTFSNMKFNAKPKIIMYKHTGITN